MLATLPKMSKLKTRYLIDLLCHHALRCLGLHVDTVPLHVTGEAMLLNVSGTELGPADGNTACRKEAQDGAH